MSVVALVIAPSIAMSADDVTAYAEQTVEKTEISKEIKVDMSANEDGTVKAIVTTTTTENGATFTEEKVIEGTEAEVKAEIDALKDVDVEIKKGKKVVKEVIEEVSN